MTAQRRDRSQGESADSVRRRATARLAAAGIDSAAVDAAELVADVLGTEPGRLLLLDDVTSDQLARIDAAVERRAQRIPLQHITSRAYFAGLELSVGPGVFVPRPETELIVEWALQQIAARGRPVHVVDLCSGSGALALAIAVLAPDATVHAVERSPEARTYLRQNAESLGVVDRVTIVAADVTDRAAVQPVLDGAQLVVCNPPYVPATSAVSPEVVHDPAEAVFSGDDGMELIDALTPILAECLRDGAAVAIEHDDTTADLVRDGLCATGAFVEIEGHADLAGRPRYVTAVRRGSMES